KGVEGWFGGGTMEACGASEKIVRIEEAKHKVGIRHRGFGAAAAIASGTRLSAGPLGPYMQHAAVVDARNRPATSADAGDIEALQRHALARDAPVGSDRGLTSDNERDICRGAAHVERNEVAMAQQTGSVLAAGNPAGRSGQHASRCQSRRL